MDMFQLLSKISHIMTLNGSHRSACTAEMLLDLHSSLPFWVLTSLTFVPVRAKQSKYRPIDRGMADTATYSHCPYCQSSASIYLMLGILFVTSQCPVLAFY